MLNFKPGVGTVVAADTKNMVAAVDDALLNSVRLYATIIEASQGSNLPVSESQRLLTSMTASLHHVVQGREEMVSTIRRLTDIKSQSNFAPMDFGCPGGWLATAEQPAEAAASPMQGEQAVPV